MDIPEQGQGSGLPAILGLAVGEPSVPQKEPTGEAADDPTSHLPLEPTLGPLEPLVAPAPEPVLIQVNEPPEPDEGPPSPQLVPQSFGNRRRPRAPPIVAGLLNWAAGKPLGRSAELTRFSANGEPRSQSEDEDSEAEREGTLVAAGPRPMEGRSNVVVWEPSPVIRGRGYAVVGRRPRPVITGRGYAVVEGYRPERERDYLVGERPRQIAGYNVAIAPGGLRRRRPQIVTVSPGLGRGRHGFYN